MSKVKIINLPMEGDKEKRELLVKVINDMYKDTDEITLIQFIDEENNDLDKIAMDEITISFIKDRLDLLYFRLLNSFDKKPIVYKIQLEINELLNIYLESDL